LSFFLIHPTLQTWHQVITIFFVHWKRPEGTSVRKWWGSQLSSAHLALRPTKTFFSDGIKKLV
jgi:hypothetical protein